MNKKIVVLVVVVECIVAILMIGVIGIAIEASNREILCQEIYFINADGEIYDNGAIVEVERPDKGFQLYYKMNPENTTDKSVTFSSSKPDDVEVSESGYVNFFIDTDVTITISTKNGKSASIILTPKRDMNGDVDIN